MNKLTVQHGLSVGYKLANNLRLLVITLNKNSTTHPLQLETLERYEDANLISVKVLDEHGLSSLGYEITHESTLQQALLYKKLTRLDFVNLVASCLKAMNDVKALGMSSSGIVFDSEFVFLNPDTFEASFVFLPLYKDDLGLSNLREFILDIIISDVIEVTDDNFIQLMIRALSPKNITIDSITAVIQPWLTTTLIKEETTVESHIEDGDGPDTVTEITTEIAIQQDYDIPYLEHVKDGELVKIPLNKEIFIIGRKSTEVDYVCGNSRVSKNHVSIIQREGIFLVVDNNSNNGTFINEKENKLSSDIEYELQPNDTLIVADDEFVLRIV